MANNLVNIHLYLIIFWATQMRRFMTGNILKFWYHLECANAMLCSLDIIQYQENGTWYSPVKYVHAPLQDILLVPRFINNYC